MIRAAFAFAAALGVAPAAAQDVPPPVWQGVWTGAIGDLPVRACLSRRGPGHAIGSYYYLRRLEAIRLEQAGGSKVWAEGYGAGGAPQPRWTFDAVGPDQLTGVWSAGARRLPFRLTRAGRLRDDEEPCGSLLFNAPRLRPVRAVAARAAKDGVAYAKLRFDPGPAFGNVEIASFALDGDGPAVRRVNAALRRGMPAAPERGRWFECAAANLNQQGDDGSYSAVVEPTLITARWLSATEASGGDCGGAHPFHGTASTTFDLSTGAEVDLGSWLAAAAVERERGSNGRTLTTVRPALRQIILRHGPAMEADCRAAVGEAEYWDIGLSRAGLRFTPDLPHVLTACEEVRVVPWTALVPFLSPAGRAGAATLR